MHSNGKKGQLLPISGLQTHVPDDLITKFLEHVQTSPDALAVLTTEKSMTYRELYLEVLHWHAVLIPYLHDKTVVCLDRTPRLLAVLLAMQWLNIPYIPIDHSLPMGRIKTIIEDSQAEALLFDALNPTDVSALACLQLNLNNFSKSPDFKQERPPYEQKSNALAYIIYTSGSTGSPKGVAVSRLALNNFLASMSRYFLSEADGLMLAITTIHFDIAALELFLPLWQKKAVFLCNEAEHKDPLSLMRLLVDYPITHLQATPSMWKLLAAMEWPKVVKLIALCGGESLSSSLAKSLLSKGVELWNMYGPTEATIWCSLKQIRPGEPITIGSPIDNTEFCVMDSFFNVLPPYVKGELYISGFCLAEGYVNKASLTKERFIPWKKALGGRLFKVGDIACSTADGEFIIFGRGDNQIKWHGFRIEPEEIEVHIQNFPGIREVAVQVNNEQLIAYLCLSSDREPFSEQKLKECLSAHLPDYMIPTQFIFLNQLIRSVSGKIARHSLPTPAVSTRPNRNNEKELTLMQLLLIHIWVSELGISDISIHDNFFELGGDSLIAARLAVKISQQFGKQISVNDFYRLPTIAQFPDLIAKASDSYELNKHKIKDENKMGSWLPLSDFQLTLWFASFFEPQVKQLNITSRRRIKGFLNKPALDLALQLVVQKQDALSYKINRFYPAQRRLLSAPKWIETSLLDVDEETCETFLANSLKELVHQSLWGRSQLMIAKLFYLRLDVVELQISMSHFICDEESLSIFFNELTNAYYFYTDYLALNAMTTSHPFFSYVAQQNALCQKHLSSDTKFWSDYLMDADYCYFEERYIIKKRKKIKACLPTYLEIPELLLTKLHQFCQKNQVTLNQVLCAAVALSLKICCKDKYPAKAKLFMNTIRSTREDSNYDKVIGCFLSLHSLKVDVFKNNTLLGLSKQIQAAMLETIEYQRAPNLVKFASIGNKSKLQKWFMSIFSLLFSKCSYLIHLNPILLKSCMAIAIGKNKKTFMINVNILNTFIEQNQAVKHKLFGFQELSTPNQAYPNLVIKNVFEVCFHRNNNSPFIAITSNLSASFLEYYGKTLVDVIKKSLDVREV